MRPSACGPPVVEAVFAVGALVLAAIAGLALRRGMRVARTLRTLAGLAPHPIAALGEGVQMVRGHVVCPEPIKSAFRQRPCAYYAFRVEEPRPPPAKPKRLATGKDWAPFGVRDDTGSVQVDSRPALIRAPNTHTAEFGRLTQVPPEHREFFEAAGIHERHLGRFTGVRVVEYTLEEGDDVHVLGSVREENGRKVFYRARHSPLAVSADADPGLAPGLRNELMLFSVSAVLFLAFAALFFVVALA